MILCFLFDLISYVYYSLNQIYDYRINAKLLHNNEIILHYIANMFSIDHLGY